MKPRALLLAIGIATLLSSPAQAEDEKSPITLTIAPYGWVPTLDGTASLGALAIPVHVTPTDFANGIKIGGMGYIRLDTDRAFVYAETIVADYDNPSFKPFFRQSLTSKVRFFEAGAGLNRTVSLGPRTKLKVSPYIGVHSLSITAFVTGDLLVATADGSWTNPVAGVTFELPVNGKLSVVGKLDGAGFGLTDTTYLNATALIDYRISKRVSLDLGYRYARGNFTNPTGLGVNPHGGGPMLALRYSVPIRR